MKKKEIKKFIHGEMSSYKEKLVIRFMSEQATGQALSYLADHIRELTLKDGDAEKLPWVNGQVSSLSATVMNEAVRHSNIASGIKIALKGLCDELTIETYEDYAMLIVDADTFELDPYTYVAGCGVAILDDHLQINSFSKLRKRYLDLAEEISKAKANMDNAKDDGVVAEITTPDNKSSTSEGWYGSFEELVQNVNAGNSSDAAPAEESPKEAPAEESPVEEESHE